MKCIHANFENVDVAEHCISSLRNTYDFSYSFLSTSNDDFESVEQNVFPFVNTLGSISNYSNFSVSFFNSSSYDETSNPYNTTKEVIARLKCKNDIAQTIANSLYSYGGHNISIT